MGFNVNEVYASDSNWLKAADLQKQEHPVTICGVSVQELKENGKTVRKLELEFVGREKRLLLNVTNSNAIGYVYGSEDTDAWLGKQIILYPTPVEYQGRQVEAIRVRVPLPQATTSEARPEQVHPAQVTSTPQSFEEATNLDDDIPF